MKKSFIAHVAIISLILVLTRLTLSINNMALKRMQDNFLFIRAKLLARSDFEYTNLVISGQHKQGECLKKVEMFYPSKQSSILKARVDIQYFDPIVLNNCSDTKIDSNRSINLPECLKNTAIYDIYVKSNRNLNDTQHICFHECALAQL